MRNVCIEVDRIIARTAATTTIPTTPAPAASPPHPSLSHSPNWDASYTSEQVDRLEHEIQAAFPEFRYIDLEVL